MTGRLDLMSAVARLLLENAMFSESVMLQRCARLLADKLAAWVIVDIERERRLRRQYVAGPRTSGPLNWSVLWPPLIRSLTPCRGWYMIRAARS